MILLDPRRGSGHLQPHIPSRIRVHSLYLDHGDASFIGHGPDGLIEAAVEIKHLSDLLASMEDGRLPASQLIGMRENYDYVFLLLHDRIASDRYGHLTVWCPKVDKDQKGQRDIGDRKYDAALYNNSKGYWARAQYGPGRTLMYVDFWKWIIGLSVGGGVRLLYAGSNEEAGEVLAAAYEWFKKDWNAHKSLKVFDNSHASPLVIPTIPMLVARALTYGVGWEKAIAVAEHFKTARAIVNADAKEWKEVDGIGDVLAKRAVRAADTVHVHRTVTGRVEDRHRKSKRD